MSRFGDGAMGREGDGAISRREDTRSPHSPFAPPQSAPSHHETYVRVRYADTDAMGVVHHANYLVYFEAARVELLRAAGISYRELEAQGILAPVVEATCRYRAPARFDDVLLVRAQLAESRPARFVFEYKIIRETDQTLIAEGRTLHACVDRATMRPVGVPAEMMEKLAALGALGEGQRSPERIPDRLHADAP